MANAAANGTAGSRFGGAAHNVGARNIHILPHLSDTNAQTHTDVISASQIEGISGSDRLGLVRQLLRDIADVSLAQPGKDALIIQISSDKDRELASRLIEAFLLAYDEVKKEYKQKKRLEPLFAQIKAIRKAYGLVAGTHKEVPGFLRGITPQPSQPLSDGQTPLINSLADDSINIMAVLGNFGSGKTYLTVSQALADIVMGRKSKIIATRKESPVHKQIGFVPGTQHDKTKRDNHAIFENIVKVFMSWGVSEKDAITKTEKLITTPAGMLPGQEIVEVVLPAQLEGRTIHDAVIILDEAHVVYLPLSCAVS